MLLPVPEGIIPRPGTKGAFGYQRTATHRHQGLDIQAVEGSIVRAADGGRVVRVVSSGTRGFSGYGAAIVIEHTIPARADKVWTLYAHLQPNSARVKPGDVVRAGDHIANVGATCGTVQSPGLRCGGAHLHFETSARPYPQGSEEPRVDPTFFLRARP